MTDQTIAEANVEKIAAIIRRERAGRGVIEFDRVARAIVEVFPALQGWREPTEGRGRGDTPGGFMLGDTAIRHGGTIYAHACPCVPGQCVIFDRDEARAKVSELAVALSDARAETERLEKWASQLGEGWRVAFGRAIELQDEAHALRDYGDQRAREAEIVGRGVELNAVAVYLERWATEGPPGWQKAAACFAHHVRDGRHRASMPDLAADNEQRVALAEMEKPA